MIAQGARLRAGEGRFLTNSASARPPWPENGAPSSRRETHGALPCQFGCEPYAVAILDKLATLALALTAACSGPQAAEAGDALEWSGPWHSRQMYTAGDYTLLAPSARDAEAGRGCSRTRLPSSGARRVPADGRAAAIYAEHDPTSEFELDLLLEHLAKSEPTVDREAEEEFKMGQGPVLKLASIPLDAARLAEYLGREELGDVVWAMTMPTEAAMKGSMRQMLSAQAEAEDMPLVVRALMPLALPFAYRYVPRRGDGAPAARAATGPERRRGRTDLCRAEVGPAAWFRAGLRRTSPRSRRRAGARRPGA